MEVDSQKLVGCYTTHAELLALVTLQVNRNEYYKGKVEHFS